MKSSRQANWYVLQVLLSALAVLFPFVLFAAEPLPPYNIDLSQTSLSGVSSGGYMAVQFHVAYSSIVRGVGVIAGGPYNCAENSAWKATHNCTKPNATYPVPDVNHLIALTNELVSPRDIDETVHMKNAKVWLFSGQKDETVKPPVMDVLDQYYRHYVNPDNVSYKHDCQAGHGMIVGDNTAEACSTAASCYASVSPYINDCSYNAAQRMLEHMYGPLKSPARQLGGTFIEFDQREFLGGDSYSHSMRDTGFAYIPGACASIRCRVHVALHGCLQHYDAIGDQFYKNAGYNEVADTNDIIVLYPQTIVRFGWNWWTLGYVLNLYACWDWWGYDNSDYYKKRGNQITAIKAMLDRLAMPRR